MLDHQTDTGNVQEHRRVVMTVAYPGDETLWAGGLILSNPGWHWHIVSIFHGNSAENEKKFTRALARLGATGDILGINDKEEKQTSFRLETIAAARQKVSDCKPDLLVTHNPNGEGRILTGRGTIGRIVCRLWDEEKIAVPKLWVFAYEEGHGEAAIYVADDSDRSGCLDKEVWNVKRDILVSTYGFSPDAYVVRVCPKEEGFFCFNHRNALRAWYTSQKSPSYRDTETHSGRRSGRPRRRAG